MKKTPDNLVDELGQGLNNIFPAEDNNNIAIIDVRLIIASEQIAFWTTNNDGIAKYPKNAAILKL